MLYEVYRTTLMSYHHNILLIGLCYISFFLYILFSKPNLVRLFKHIFFLKLLPMGKIYDIIRYTKVLHAYSLLLLHSHPFPYVFCTCVVCSKQTDDIALHYIVFLKLNSFYFFLWLNNGDAGDVSCKSLRTILNEDQSVYKCIPLFVCNVCVLKKGINIIIQFFVWRF